MSKEDVLKDFYRPKKIAVCIPWNSPFIWMHAAFNMMNLNRPEGIEVKFLNGMGRNPGMRHAWGVKKALEWGASHICFLGGDQLHPMDILEKFCVHMEKGWPACTALVPIRGRVNVQGIERPFQKCAWKWKKKSEEELKAETAAIKDGVANQAKELSIKDLELIDPKDGPYQEIVVIGSGALMFSVDLLHAMKKPWFIESQPDEDGFVEARMDTTFSWRLVTEAQGRILADLTINIQHLDVFPIDETYGIRFGDWTQEKRAAMGT